MNLTHLDENNRPKMVDVSTKDITKRIALASGRISMSKDAFLAIKNHTNKKGAVLETAIVAAIMGAKKTSELIPMCHPLMISNVQTNIEECKEDYSFKLFVRVKCENKTGVEMEALTGVSIGLLTIYDMVKAIDKTMIISDIMLLSKEGGKSGKFERN
ncbi:MULTISPECIES: cyclic pyranopterin monophosphate synthase MoaC [unclassified Campylobacter]|uniref:cyclic pyranopterin monophosphate synthase MoaC n=1 Tax=unclassified Campylobacter TaxID=2593542 RepID=UPI001237FB78|nr:MULTISPECIES: cyclic pyranopterin monophosphate synthase MoaC [unclassified Campylobacter]KAA6227220.1 cyclic pyranopterin monophosphate synthase MoaC [Campylobacter sp. LR286c]KAA6227906.1 cyclic pyranopterin monophosphate synthase MoaC [Campylobacter sp. LR185c]KAA6228315.1 cyclic pyranopterin monophosphate synthase MoaC [Campylobacter sp. LR196d]KAA6229316.1 cyclic pyranopterin monophosphate synthase MoaC [Campylobacter sp. LR291e]KAA6231122.1 cyclic pyranopterin monophosphate synthase M